MNLVYPPPCNLLLNRLLLELDIMLGSLILRQQRFVVPEQTKSNYCMQTIDKIAPLNRNVYGGGIKM